MEEAGVSVEVLDIVGIYSNVNPRKGYNGVETIPTIVNIDFICRYVSGELTTSPESVEVKWVTKQEAVQMVYPRLLLRLDKMLRHADEFTCLGFSLDEAQNLIVHEEYVF